ncbi:MATH and LRR domain-containing protein PFE0570w isoform X1 [Stomoxys calcitrans]|uniref:MATH and LRR domain-containing protein PFE0570w isoform X1 n=1 Tax=Stomoxys calcitrans TaxID=35570 RepID=UPI0027E36288|nr:MATH and LRR domain-containing protein PFE0570w isoform X1 [Stomoxys calcitrans]
MAKVKLPSKASSTKNSSTPRKIAKGKIKKNVSNGKKEKLNAKQQQHSDYLSKCYEIQSQTRLCFVNLKRSSIMENATANCSANSNNISGIEQAQCTDTNTIVTPNIKDNNKKVDEANKKSNANAKPKKNISSTLRNIAGKGQEATEIETRYASLKTPLDDQCSLAKTTEKNNNELYFQRRCCVRIKKLRITQKDLPSKDNKAPKTLKKEELIANAALQDEILATSLSQIENPALDQEKRKAFSKLSLAKRHHPSAEDDKENKNNDNEYKRISSQTLNKENRSKKLIDNTAKNVNKNSIDKENDKYPTRTRRLLRQSNSKTIEENSATALGKDNKSNEQAKSNFKDRNGKIDNNLKLNITKERTNKLSKPLEKKLDATKRGSNQNNKDDSKSTEEHTKVKEKDNKNDTGSTEKSAKARRRIIGRKFKDDKVNVTGDPLANAAGTEGGIKKAGEIKTRTRGGDKKVDDIIKTRPKRAAKPMTLNTNSKNKSKDRMVSVITNKQSEKEDAPINGHENIVESSLKSKSKPEVATSDVKNKENTNKKYNSKGMNSNTAKNNAITNTTMMDMQHIHFVPQRNSTMHFEVMLSHNKSPIKQHEKELTNRVDNKISASGSTENIITKSTTSNLTNLNNRTNKFFHRHENENVWQNSQNPQCRKRLAATNVTNKTPLSKKHRLLSKRSSQARREKVYEFLSQSQTSESESGNGSKIQTKPVDPMADVIKKLISQGKVAVATNQKGKGKPKLKPTKPKRVTNKNKQKKITPSANIKNKEVVLMPPPSPPAPINKSKESIDADNEENYDRDDFDHFMEDDDDINPDVNYNFNEPAQPGQKPQQNHVVAEQEGTFSNLARSVLISQAERNDAQRLKAQRLLAMAKKLISTPKNPKMPSPQAAINSDLSPIAPPTGLRPPTKPSPWRVNEDAYLPRVFNFSRSSGNLPSFSSDYIPPTPKKETLKNKVLQALRNNSSMNPNQTEQNSFIPAVQSHTSTPLVVNNRHSSGDEGVLSSFSSNDSNGENNPPPVPPNMGSDKNANIFDLKQLPNPRRTLTYRSPLKAINILEVVHLPPITDMNDLSKEKSHVDMFGFEEFADNDTSFKTPQKVKQKNLRKGREAQKKSPDRDLFGFEEFLSQTEASSQEAAATPQKETFTNKINEKLQGLRKLRPDTSELEINFASGKDKPKFPELFRDPGDVAKPQKTIKQMLCSTMVEQPSTSKRALEELNLRKQAMFQCPPTREITADISEIFKDVEPETTFNEQDPHRTYVRPYKRKRRLRDNKLVFVLESDESDIEDLYSPEKKKKKDKKKRELNKSHETDTSSEHPPNKKKRRAKENPELKTFVEEFQEMCKDVESYQLIVEKSA